MYNHDQDKYLKVSSRIPCVVPQVPKSCKGIAWLICMFIHSKLDTFML